MNFIEKIPLNALKNSLTDKCGVSLYVLRLDALDYYAGGNKFFKLKYNLEEARRQGHKKLLTFGGAWSNHLAAVAVVAGQQLEVIAVVRGEEPKEYSDTLRFCKEKGVRLHFVSREEYRRKNEPGFIEELRKKFGNFYLLPEGGSNELAAKGCREILEHINIDFDYACCPVGSGGTIAGIASGLKPHQKALGFTAVKGGEYLSSIIHTLAPEASNFKLATDYHFGGFAKVTLELRAFKKQFETENGFELDYIYTSKMFYGIFDLLQKGFFTPGSKIVAIHTGGLQGNAGFTES